MDSWYVAYTTGRTLHPPGETQGRGWPLKTFPGKQAAIEFALMKHRQGYLAVEAGTCRNVLPAEKLTSADLEKLG